MEALAYIREQIMSELVRLTAKFEEDNAFATPQQRAAILTQLLDRLIKLDVHLKPYEPTEMYRLPNGKLVPFLIDYDIDEIPDEDYPDDEDPDDEEYNRFLSSKMSYE